MGKRKENDHLDRHSVCSALPKSKSSNSCVLTLRATPGVLSLLAQPGERFAKPAVHLVRFSVNSPVKQMCFLKDCLCPVGVYQKHSDAAARAKSVHLLPSGRLVGLFTLQLSFFLPLLLFIPPNSICHASYSRRSNTADANRLRLCRLRPPCRPRTWKVFLFQ